MEWIKVKDKLPQSNTPVLVTCRAWNRWKKTYYYNRCIAIYIPERTFTIEDVWLGDDNTDLYEDNCYVKEGWYEKSSYGDLTECRIPDEVIAWSPILEVFVED